MSKLRTNLARSQGRSAGPYQNPRLMLLLRGSAIDLVTDILEQNVQITNQFGMVNLVVWPDLCHSIQIARKIRRPISESATDVAAQRECNRPGYRYFGTECPNYEPIWHARSQGRSAGPYQNPRLMLLLRNIQITNQFGTVNLVVWPDLCHSSQIARKIRRPISESAADVAAQSECNGPGYPDFGTECPNYKPISHVRWLGGSAGPYQNPRLMLLLRGSAIELVTHILEQNIQITNQFGTVNLVVWPDLCHSSQIARKIRRPISESAADVAAQRECNRAGYPYFGTEYPNYEPIWHVRWLGGSAGPYQNPRLMLLLRGSAIELVTHILDQNIQITNQFGTNIQITNQFGTVNLVVWRDLCHSSQIARKIRRPISESAADVAAQSECNGAGFPDFGTECPNYKPISHVRWLGGSAGPYQNPRLMLLLRGSAIELVTHILEQNIQITNQCGTVNLVVWPDLCHSSQIARKIRRPISESAADVAAQRECNRAGYPYFGTEYPNYEPIWHVRWLGGSAGPYQNPQLMLLLRILEQNVQITNQFGTVNLVVWPDLCHSSQIARRIRRPISESAADVAAQTRSQGRSAGPYQNPRLMLLLRGSAIEPGYPYFGTEYPNYEPIWHASRSQGRSAGPYQNPRLMLLLRVNAIGPGYPDFGTECPNYKPIWHVRWLGGSAGPYQNPRLMLLLRNVQITNQFGMVNLVVWPDLCHSSQIARKIRRPISESAADVAAQKYPNYEPIWHVRWLGGSAGPYQNPRLMLLLRNVQITNQFGTVNLVVWPDLCHSIQIARKIRRPISESAADVAAQKCPNYEPIWHARSQGRSAGPYQNPRLMLLLRNIQITNQFGTMARRIRRPISESAADVAAQRECNRAGYPYFGPEYPNYEPIWHVRWLGGSAGPYQNPRLMLLLRVNAMDLVTQILEQNVQITNQFRTVNLVVWPDLCHSSQIARKIRRPISESAADVAAQSECNGPGYPDFGPECPNYKPISHVRWLGGSAGPYQNPRLMLLLRNGQITNQFGTNVQITNQFGTVNLVVWPDLCQTAPTSQMARRSAGPYQNPRLMLLLRNVQITNQFGTQIARRIRRPISESAADVAAQKCQITNQFGTVNLVVWPDLCHSSQIARKIRRPISESAADVAAQKCPNYEPIWHVRWLGGSAGPYQNPRLMLLLRNVQITNQFGTVNLVVWPDLCHSSQIARKIRRPISESAADVAAQKCPNYEPIWHVRWLGGSAGPYQNPRLMLLLRNVQITNQFGTVNLVVWPDLCHSSQIARKIRRPISESAADVAAQKCPNYEPIWHVRWLGGSAGPYQNPRLMLLLRNGQITNQFGTVNLVVWPDLCHSSQIARKIRRPISESAADVAAQKCPNYEPIWHVRWLGGSAGPYQNPRLMLLLRNVQITNQFGTVNLVVWPDLCHSSQIARKIRRPISESAADVAAQKCPNYEPIWHARSQGRSAGPYQNPRLMLLLRNVQITNQFGTVNLVVWPDLCHSSQIARKIRRPISESAADVAAQTRSQGGSAGPYQNPRLMLLLRPDRKEGSAGPYQNPRLMLLLRNGQITNQFGTVNLVVWPDLCHSSQIARKIRRPISESAADVAAQKCPNYEPIWHVRSLGGSAGPYQNPRLMLLLRNVQITNQFGTVNLVVWPDLCHSSQIARKIRRPISESAADVAAQKCPNYEPIWHARSQGGSAGPYQNPRLMLLLRNVQITNQFGTVNLVVWPDLCHSSQIARKIRRPISESAADVAAQKCPNYEPIWHARSQGRSAGPYQNPRLMLLLRNVQITNQFGTVNLVVWPDLCHSSQIARKIRRPISESAADVAAQKCPNYEPIWHARSQGRSAGPYQNPRLMLLLRNVQITNQFGTVNLVVWPDLCQTAQPVRWLGGSAGPYQNPRLMLLLRNVQITNQFGTVNLVVWPDLCHSSQIARKIRRPISESAADVAAQKCPNYEPIWHARSQGRSAGPYQNPRLMLLLRNVQITNQFGTVNLVVWPDLCQLPQPVRWLGGSAGPYQNPRLMLLLRNVQITNQFGTVNLVVWPDLCHSSQIARRIRRPISESAADVAAQKCPNYEPIWHARSQGGSAGPYQNPRLMLLLRNVQITNQFGTVNLVVWPDLCHSSQIARKIRRPISESAADVAAQKCPNYEPIWHARSQGRSAGPYQNPRLMLLLRNVQITNQFGTVNLVVWPDLCQPAPTSQMARRIRRPISESAADVAAQKCPNYEPIWHARWLGGSAGPYQNPRLMLLLRNVQITNQFGTVNLVVWPDLCQTCPNQLRWLGGSASPYQNPRLMLLLRNVQITNQFGTVNLVVWADLCHSSQIARKIRRPISESAADVAAQKCPNYEPIWHVRWLGGSAGPYQNPRLMLLLRNVQITNQFGTMARRIRRPISESAADVAVQKCPNYDPIWHGEFSCLARPVPNLPQPLRWLGGSASPYQNPRLMLLFRNVQITNQFGTVNLVVWPDLCRSSQIARKIRRPISESAADVAVQKCPNYDPIWHGGSAGPYQNPRLMLLFRILEQNVQITNQFGTILEQNVQITIQFGTMARRIRRPISESAADVAVQNFGTECPNYEPIWHGEFSCLARPVPNLPQPLRWLGGSAGPYQNPRLMLLFRNVQITHQFGTVNLVVWAHLCHSSQIARKIRWPISESAADVAVQTRSQGRSAGPYQNPRLMLLFRILEQNVQITIQFGTMARRIRWPISESAADVAVQKCPNYDPIWHGEFSCLARPVPNLPQPLRWLGGSAGPYQNPRLMLLFRIARKIRRPISESAADVAAQKCSNYEPIQIPLSLDC
ncbi:hypothetical protein GGX14DRAFT_393624 [Mycena pura]|uniref:Uncharacterized protein n=1 Tax=Mycena pura TaxID=153505 RepID=A0AAD6YE82_9AGAR|nr:hypothetical protein GGX14DRAFT_393624 [Mycena pura]